MTATAARKTAPTPPPAPAPAPIASSVPLAPFRAVVLLAARLAPTRSSNPRLPDVNFVSAGGVLTVISTNLEVVWEDTIPAPDLPDSVFSVPAARLRALLPYAGKADNLPIELIDNTLRLYLSEQATTVTMQANTETAPLRADAEPDGPYPHSLPAAELRAALSTVLYAASDAAFQAVFRGICMSNKGGINELAASDGFRLATYAVSGPLPYAVIPKQSCLRLITGLAGMKENARVEIAVAVPGRDADEPADTLVFRFGTSVVRVKCMDGQFPDYRRVIPTEGLAAGWVRSPLLSRLGLLRVMADKNSNNRVVLTQRGSVMTLSTEGDYGQAEGALNMEHPLMGAAKETSAAYNVDYLMDALRSAPEEPISVVMQGKAGGVLCLRSGPYLACVVALRS